MRLKEALLLAELSVFLLVSKHNEHPSESHQALQMQIGSIAGDRGL
jgi:hypothetical protein